MKVYFSAAIAQKDELGKDYNKIVSYLEKAGHKIFQDTTEVTFNEAVNKTEKQRVEYYAQVIEWISKSDFIVVEASFPSTLHIGHEISLALERGKPVIALYRKRREPSFFLGLKEDKLLWIEYEENTLECVLENALDYISGQMDVRFNLFLSSKMSQYLDKISHEEKVSKSHFIRSLIRKHMQENAASTPAQQSE